MRDDGDDERGGPGQRGAGTRRRSLDGMVELDRLPDDATVVTNLDELSRRVGDAAATSDALHPHLIVIAGNNVGKYFRLDRPTVYLGRGETCEVMIQDTGVSRKHARVLLDPTGEVWLEDLDSTNGTFVENHRIERRLLRDGDKIQLGRTTIIKFSLTDATELRFAEQMYVSATHDGLTRINNRKFFDEQFLAEFAFAARHRLPLSVLMIDLDHFKQVNDTHGHQTGDHVLRVVARTLARMLRTEDLLARYGGEEFVILARGIDKSGAAVVGERVRSTIESLLIPLSSEPGGALRITVSVGIATFADGVPASRVALLAAADATMYRAKRNGRNRVEQWSETDPVTAPPSNLSEDTNA
ncbi:MAG: GGDEF domain-containing protein [Deltaproteobacteria bacterium]|nr:GGDEF domain-containing protein [Deltaproteobacteria bacterium]